MFPLCSEFYHSGLDPRPNRVVRRRIVCSWICGGYNAAARRKTRKAGSPDRDNVRKNFVVNSTRAMFSRAKILLCAEVERQGCGRYYWKCLRWYTLVPKTRQKIQLLISKVHVYSQKYLSPNPVRNEAGRREIGTGGWVKNHDFFLIHTTSFKSETFCALASGDCERTSERTGRHGRDGRERSGKKIGRAIPRHESFS